MKVMTKDTDAVLIRHVFRFTPVREGGLKHVREVWTEVSDPGLTGETFEDAVEAAYQAGISDNPDLGTRAYEYTHEANEQTVTRFVDIEGARAQPKVRGGWFSRKTLAPVIPEEIV